MKVETADEKVRRHLNIIEEQVAQTEVIISNILNFSRTGSPRLEKADLGRSFPAAWRKSRPRME